LLVCDFDGVLVDGMEEYWWTARRAVRRVMNVRGEAVPDLPQPVPEAFALLRPRIHRGWEMVLIAAELGRHDFDPAAAHAGYEPFLADALGRRGWRPGELQESLEAVRREAIAADLAHWLGLHRFYPGVKERLRRLEAEGIPWAVLTTKGGAFAARLLAGAGLHPSLLYGHEQGSKPEVLLRLRSGEAAPVAAGRPLWFVEDRRPTLERVRATPGLETVRCYLAAWGYLAPGDERGLEAAGIRWLAPEGFAAPLAQWP
jgi:phosphoglycolate phosphatase-like HAD superfamily hydrolase